MIDILNFFNDLNSPEVDDPNSAAYEAARAAWQRGWNVIPLVHKTKRASVKYAHWHHERQKRAEVAMMRPLFDGGLAVITGAISGIVVFDTDGEEGERIIDEFEGRYGRLPETWTVRSGSGRGVHRYFNHPGGRVRTSANPSIKLDIKGDGGIAVLPPTRHKNGGHYAVEIDVKIAPLPNNLIEFIELQAGKERGSPRTFTPVSKVGVFLADNLTRKVPINRRNVLIVKSMLLALPVFCADDYDTWLKIGFVLHSFDPGPTGLALWKRFSKRVPHKADLTNFDSEWAAFDRPYAGQKVTLGTLRFMAEQHGWKPIPWGWNEDL